VMVNSDWELAVDEQHELPLATTLLVVLYGVSEAVLLWACVYSGCYSIG